MIDRPNIVWLLVDSVRSYATDEDDRGKLPMMERFGEHSVEFLNVVTSAPSTIMAISAMMASMPSYMIARNYENFMFDSDYFTSLNEVLKAHRYLSMAFFRHPHPRAKFGNLLDAVPRQFWEAGLKHSDIWTNRDLHAVLKNALRAGLQQPAFLFVHFTCRRDPDTSEIVESALHDLLDADFSYDNTIYVLCSDHGYPDPSRGFTPEGLKRQGLTHDLVLTDDNIKIPLFFHYPGCSPRKVDTTVSSLDIAPTILDLAGIPIEQYGAPFHGISLKSLMEGQTSARPGSQYVRSDGRLLYQTGRVTAIRNDSYKYIRRHDCPEGHNEELYDLVQDPLEGKNIAASTELGVRSTLEGFRAEFDRQEQEAIQQHVNYLLSRFRTKVGSQRRQERVLAVIESPTAQYGEVALETLNRAWPAADIDVLLHVDEQVPENLFSHVYRYAENGSSPYASAEIVGEPPKGRYAVLLLFTLNPSSPTAKPLLQLSKQVHADNRLVLDCNMNTYSRRRFWYYGARAAFARLKEGYREPRILLRELVAFRRMLTRRLLKRSK